jgi:hypothetical protein
MISEYCEITRKLGSQYYSALSHVSPCHLQEFYTKAKFGGVEDVNLY